MIGLLVQGCDLDLVAQPVTLDCDWGPDAAHMSVASQPECHLSATDEPVSDLAHIAAPQADGLITFGMYKIPLHFYYFYYCLA